MSFFDSIPPVFEYIVLILVFALVVLCFVGFMLVLQLPPSKK